MTLNSIPHNFSKAVVSSFLSTLHLRIISVSTFLLIATSISSQTIMVSGSGCEPAPGFPVDGEYTYGGEANGKNYYVHSNNLWWILWCEICGTNGVENGNNFGWIIINQGGNADEPVYYHPADSDIPPANGWGVYLEGQTLCPAPAPTLSGDVIDNPSLDIVPAWTQIGEDLIGEMSADLFGESVAISGDGRRIAVGAPAGYVKVYDVNGSSVEQIAKITTATAGNQFGKAIDMSADGNTIVIGAQFDSGNGSLSGQVRVYRRVAAGTYDLLGTPINGNVQEKFGRTVSISDDGNTIAAAAPKNLAGGSGFQSGIVRVYQFDGADWSLLGQEIPGNAAGETAGWSLSLSEDGMIMAIGAPDEFDLNDDVAGFGRVRTYQYDGTNWQPLGQEIAGGQKQCAGSDAHYGWSVSLSDDGNRLAIGSPKSDANNLCENGLVEIYTFSNNAWQKLGNTILGNTENEGLGYTLEFSGDGNRLAIGGIGFDDGIGRSVVYEWSGSDWLPFGQDIYSDESAESTVSSVAISADGIRYIAGNYDLDDPSINIGRARAYFFMKVNRWIGELSSLWERDFNWEMNVLPDENTAVIVPNNRLIIISDGFDAVANSITLGVNATLIVNGNLTLTDNIIGAGMQVIGTGTINGSLVHESGFYRPGASPGILTINGDYENTGGVLEIDINGNAPGTEHDQLIVTGTATFDPTSRMHIDFGSMPNPGSSFEVLLASEIIGQFAPEQVTFEGGDVLDVSLSYANGKITVHPVLPCVEPELVAVTAPQDLQCPESNVTINIDGTLNSAAHWALYVGDCTGTPIATTTGSSFEVQPLETTTYYVVGEGNCTVSRNCQAVTIQIGDLDPPTITCGPDVTVSTDPGSCATAAAAVGATVIDEATALDNCGVATLSYSPEPGSLFSVGMTVVTLTATDANSNQSTCTVTVTVEDNEPPAALCQDVTVQLDENGNGTTTAAAVDGGSNDACGIAGLALDVTTFGCENLGLNSVILTVTDNSSNTSTCTATVTVEDNVPPAALCQDVTVQLDENGTGTTTAAAVDGGSNDACGIAGLALNVTAFSCEDLGANSVVLTVTDSNANTSTCTATVTVERNDVPVAACLAATVHLDASGNASIDPGDVYSGSLDVCELVTFSVTPNMFNCNDLGSNTVTLTVTDWLNGASTSCMATVTVEDDTPPEALCRDVTVQLDENRNGGTTAAAVDNGSNDACGIADLVLDVTTFGIEDVGPNLVTLTAMDNNGNTSTCTATVTVEDFCDPPVVTDIVTMNGTAFTCSGPDDGIAMELTGNNLGAFGYLSWSADPVGAGDFTFTFGLIAAVFTPTPGWADGFPAGRNVDITAFYTRADGCTATFTKTFTIYPGIQPLVGIENSAPLSLAGNVCTGSSINVEAQPAGGLADPIPDADEYDEYSYQWEIIALPGGEPGPLGNAVLTNATQRVASFFPDPAANDGDQYALQCTITDIAGCTAVSDPIILTVMGPTEATIALRPSVVPHACSGEDIAASNQYFGVNITGGTPGYDVVLRGSNIDYGIDQIFNVTVDGSGNVTGPVIFDNPASAAIPITYTLVSVQDLDGCDLVAPGGISGSVAIYYDPVPNAMATAQNEVICSGDQAVIDVITSVTDPISFTWTADGDAGSSAAGADMVALGPAAINDGALTNNTDVDLIVTYTITPYTYGPNGMDDGGTGDDCLGTPQTVDVIVQPEPIATPSAATETICHNSAPTITVDVTAPDGNRYLVASISNPGGVGGVGMAPYTKADAQTIEDGPLTNTTNATQTVAYTIVPYNYGSNGIDDGGAGDDCLGVPFEVEIDVLSASTGGDCFAQDCINSGEIQVYAGMPGVPGGTDGIGTNATFTSPFRLAIDANDHLYVAEYVFGNTIRKIAPGGVVTTLAGASGESGYLDATGAAARFNRPRGLDIDAAGNVYVADMLNRVIRKVTPGGEVTTLAGSPGVSGYADGTGAEALFANISNIAIDASGNLYVVEFGNHAIRKVTPEGVVTTFAGSGTEAGNADGTGGDARFNSPQGLAFDASGNLYVADWQNYLIRKVTPAGVVTTVAGSGTEGTVDGTGAAAGFRWPYDIAFDSKGDMYVADWTNVRKVTLEGVVTTVAPESAVDGGVTGIAVDSYDNIYFVNNGTNVVWKIGACPEDSGQLAILRQDPAGASTNADAVTFRVQFAEGVQHVDATDFALSGTAGGGALGTPTMVNADPALYDVPVSGLGNTDGTLNLDIAPGNNIQNLSGAALGSDPVIGVEQEYQLDNTSPLVLISSTESSPTAASPIPITVTFSEEVTGFEARDLTLVNGTVGNFSTSDNIVFTFDLTPAIDGIVTVDVTAGAAGDLAGNDNVAAGQFSICAVTCDPVDNTQPVAVAGPDQLVFIGENVQLNGGGSFDDDGDPLTFDWYFISMPPGSTAVLSDGTAPAPIFTADLEGEYLIELVVNDGITSSPSNQILITATLPPGQAAGEMVSNVFDLVSGDELATDPAKDLISKLTKIILRIGQGKLTDAVSRLQDFMDEVNTLMADGTLSEAAGNALLADAQAILDQLTTDLFEPTAGASPNGAGSLERNISILQEIYRRLTSNVTTQAVSATEVDALIAFYNATNGPNWTNNTNWLNGMDPCDAAARWYGIACDGSGNVTDILLADNGLAGYIPAEIGALLHLRSLDLFDNQVGGAIPSEIGSLTNLEYLDLFANQLDGLIPTSLENLVNLHYLDLSGNQLSGAIPVEIGALVNLQYLDLFGNQLGGNIPPVLKNLLQLRYLDLSSNQLSGAIPPELGDLLQLTFLNLFDNQLNGAIPTELRNLTSLKQLLLSNNQLQGAIPTDLSNLANLTFLDLSGNQLSGAIPAELGGLSDLRQLLLFSNQLNGMIPPDLGNLSNLVQLQLSGNLLSGALPAELGNLSQLTQLNLSDNELTGNLPATLGNLGNLTQLGLSGNQLEGGIPAEIGNLSKLKSLLLFNNRLRGQIPAELAQLFDLLRLYLHDNQLSGCFPQNMKTFCGLPFSALPSQNGYNFSNNPALPWQGDFSRFCGGEEQTGASCDDGNPNTENDVITADCGCTGQPTVILIAPRLYLQGPYDPATGLMTDQLRAGNLLPSSEPYAALGYDHLSGGGEIVQASVLTVTGTDAIVDWLFLELRDKNDATTVLATRSALLQADGDVVDTDGVSPVTFTGLPLDDYYLVVRHRNHISVSTAAPVSISSSITTMINFTSNLDQVAGGANGIAVLADGKLGLFSGDFNSNGQVQNTDYNDMVQTLGTSGYLPGDFDLNGQVQNTDLQFNLTPNIGRGEAF